MAVARGALVGIGILGVCLLALPLPWSLQYYEYGFSDVSNKEGNIGPGEHRHAPASYGSAPVSYGSAPVSYGSAPVSYGHPEAHRAIGRDIIYTIILYYILYRASGVANGKNHFLLHAAVHPGLH